MMKEENNTVKLDTFRNIKDLKWCVKHTQLAVMVLVPGLCGLGCVCMCVCACVCVHVHSTTVLMQTAM